MTLLDEHTLWMRLEGRADLLEATRIRCIALQRMLRSYFWRERLRRNVELLREVAQSQPEVEALLRGIRLRAEAEGWPQKRGPLKLVRDVEALMAELERRVEQRRGVAGAGLSTSLLAVESDVLGEPRRFFYPGAVWAAANELLPRNLPELRALNHSATVLAGLASRPDPASGAFPLSQTECLHFVEALATATPAVSTLRARLATLERTGTVLALIDRKATAARPGRPRTGAEQLVYGAAWTEYARARMARWLSPWVRPLSLRDEEYAPLLRWIGQVRTDPSLSFDFRQAPRDALLETALRSSAVLLGRQLIPHHAAALRAAAARAEGADRGERLLLIGALVASGGGVTGSLAGFSLTDALQVENRLDVTQSA